jgi:hypothetical protein
MRDLTRRGTIAAPSKGLAFEIADLLLVRQWAERHDLRMLIRLDHGAAVGEEYEEVVTFHTQTSPLYRYTMWRDATTVFVQPLVGRGKQYRSVAAALAAQSARSGTPARGYRTRNA